MPEDRDAARRLVNRSRELVRRSHDHVQPALTALQASERRLERARNVLQAATLKRELRRRRPPSAGA
jgi:hypothetical protein